jgi:phospholipid N-methyltransferase
MGTLSYVKNFLTDLDVAAVAPSTRFLVRRVCRWIDFSESCVVVEYGPGDGVFSRHIRDRMTDDSTLLLIESNESFVRELREQFGDDDRVTVVEDRAERVEQITAAAGHDTVDYVVSGIPFSFLDEDVKHDLLTATRRVLTDDGKFLVYQVYNHMEEPLREHFHLRTKEYELLNLPPMFAYEALQPADAADASRDPDRREASPGEPAVE